MKKLYNNVKLFWKRMTQQISNMRIVKTVPGFNWVFQIYKLRIGLKIYCQQVHVYVYVMIYSQ